MEEFFCLIVAGISDFIESSDFIDDLKYIVRRVGCNLIAKSFSDFLQKVKNHSNGHKSGSDKN